MPKAGTDDLMFAMVTPSSVPPYSPTPPPSEMTVSCGPEPMTVSATRDEMPPRNVPAPIATVSPESAQSIAAWIVPYGVERSEHDVFVPATSTCRTRAAARPEMPRSEASRATRPRPPFARASSESPPPSLARSTSPYTRTVETKKRRARGWFDRRAQSYEGGLTSRWRDPVQRAALDALDLSSSDRLLDVGCGTGAASRAAAERGVSVIGIDLSPKMIDEAVTLARGLDGVEFRVADVEHLPFPEGTFSAVLCSNSFHHYPDPATAVAEMVGVLKRDGRVTIGDATSDLLTARVADRFLRWFEPGHVRLYRAAELGAFLTRARLERVELKRITDGAFAIARGVKR
jgi:ubiquinone/menaquinone biosynthesis C-methylase UbiE